MDDYLHITYYVYRMPTLDDQKISIFRISITDMSMDAYLWQANITVDNHHLYG